MNWFIISRSVFVHTPYRYKDGFINPLYSGNPCADPEGGGGSDPQYKITKI